jgi:mgtE-like transporter
MAELKGDMEMQKGQKKAKPSGFCSALIAAHIQVAPLSQVTSFFHNFSDLFRQAPFSLLFCTFTGLLAGIGLSLMTDMLQLLPGLLIVIPPAIALRGNVYSALVSRLGTSMHLGLFSPTLRKGSVLYQNAYTSLSLTLILSVILGALAKIIADAFGIPCITLQGFIFISVLGGIISGIILLGIAILVSITGYNRNWDLDNISSPIITSAGDMVTIPSLHLAAVVLLNLNLLNIRIMGKLSLVALLSILFISVALFCVVIGLRTNDAAVRRIFVESIPMLFICAILGTLAGIRMDMALEHLIAIPSFLILIPPFSGGCNALGGILSARLSSMLHIGTVSPKRVPDKLISANFVVIYVLSVFVFSFVGILAFVVSNCLGVATPSILKMLFISLIGGILCTTFLNFASYYIAILSFRFGLDPDNDTIPLITSLTDVVCISSLMFAISIII